MSTAANSIKLDGDMTRRIKQMLFGSKEQQALLEDLATLIDDGVPPNKALEVLVQVHRSSVRDCMLDMLLMLSQGRQLATGMQGWFPDYIVELIRAGEEGGSIADTMHAAARALGQKNDAITSLFSSLTYPIVVNVMAIVVLLYMNKSVFGQFASIKPIERWPVIGQNLVAMAHFIQDWGIVVLVCAAGFTVFLSLTIRFYTGEFRQYLDYLPLFSIYRKMQAARLMETMGLLISNGVVFKRTLEIMYQKASPYLMHHLMIMEMRLGGGRQNVADVMHTGLINTSDVLRLRVTAEAKGFEHALVRMGRYAADKGNKTIALAGKLTGGAMLALGAWLAGYMVLGIYQVGSSLAT